MYILGLNISGHDGAACLMKNGRILNAILEERLTRKKHCSGYIEAVKYCLSAVGISINQINYLVITDPYLTYDHVKKSYQKFELLGRTFYLGKDLHFVDHYLSHCSSAYYI